MAIEFIGSSVQAGVLTAAGTAGPAAGTADGTRDPDYPFQAAAAAEEAGFDQLLVGYDASAADGLLVANGILTTTSRIGVVVAHVPGLAAPSVAARQFATLAAFHRGRVAVHAVTELAAGAAAREGDDCEPAVRSARAVEYLQVVRQAWDAQEPFDHSGAFYRVQGAWASVNSAGRRVPVYWSGGSEHAMQTGAAHADVFLFGGARPAVIAVQVARTRAAAGLQGRAPRFGVILRLLAAPTERAALDRRRALAPANLAASPNVLTWIPSVNLGSTASAGSITGSYDQAAQLLLDYVTAGVSTLVLEHDLLADAADCAAVIARVRHMVGRGRHLVA